MIGRAELEQFSTTIKGDFFFDETIKRLYATDASVYRQLPLAVAYPKDASDIQKLAQFASKHSTSLIPRAAGTSLAGQCVGDGIVVDVSRYMTQILELNVEERWVRVQPGVIRDELNYFLSEHGLFFAPNTSTSNRCMLGGMIGNNSCGSTSIKYGSTRDHLMSIKGVLSDGSEVVFEEIDEATFNKKQEQKNREGELYQLIYKRLSDEGVRAEIKREYPKPEVSRRNTGYALDMLMECKLFEERSKQAFNFCKLIAGSEGTLAFITEAKLHLEPLPPPEKALVCIHFADLTASLKAAVIAVEHSPEAVELIDHYILDCTKTNRAYNEYRFFIEGEPQAVLAVEMAADSSTELEASIEKLIEDMRNAKLAYAYPVVRGSDMSKVWDLRKAGLGLLSNIPGDAKAVAFVEDTAVSVADLPAYIQDFDRLLAKYGKSAVHYAHAGAGEIHLRPILNLKDAEEVKLFEQIGLETAQLVKKYGGANSGEHGDGRVRGPFVELMLGKKNYALLKEVKSVFDPKNIFNPGKIVDAIPISQHLRYDVGVSVDQPETLFRFDDTEGILRMAEKCNGSGDCRKTELSGGTMCPSYMATKNESDTTRGRANMLREVLTHSDKVNRFDDEELCRVLDLCLACKGCASECPSNVDIATMKAEFLYQYQQANGIPLRSKLFANIGKLNQLGAKVPSLSNFLMSNSISGPLAKKMLGVAAKRKLPLLHKISLRKWYKNNYAALKPETLKGKVFFFCDEFTNYLDTEIGIKSIQLLTRLGYEVEMPEHEESGRAHISKGLLEDAQKMARANVNYLKNRVSKESPLVGIEPSAILSFRDEYPRLVETQDEGTARELGTHTMMIEEFLWKEAEAGNISSSDFNQNKAKILLHGHCHQKALSSVDFSAWMLGLPQNYEVEVIASGCCGMAGSFGYEKEHYDVSMQVGELVLFPAVRKADIDVKIAAPGTSCRHQIADGTMRTAMHPVEILFDALK